MNNRHQFCTSEFEDPSKINSGGRGFYNEFGIESAIGFDEFKPGERFHKIGVGLLKKDREPYFFINQYDIQPAHFETKFLSGNVLFTILSDEVNGYAYLLRKSIVLDNSSFSIEYSLKNTGDKAFHTSEYVHNFLSLNGSKIGPDYSLRFPFIIDESNFVETVNPLNELRFEKEFVKWNLEISETFYIGKMNSIEYNECSWELRNMKEKIGIREVCTGR